MTRMQELKESSGLSFRNIAEELSVDLRYAWLAVNEPHRVTKEIFISVAGLIGMKHDDAEDYWKEKKQEDFNRRLG